MLLHAIVKFQKMGYKTYIDEIIKFLSGNKVDILKKLETKNDFCFKKQDYENAIKYRDKIQNIEDIMINQKISSTKSLSSKDVIAVATNNIIACVTVFFIRARRVLGRENFILKAYLMKKFQQLYQSLLLSTTAIKNLFQMKFW